MAAVGRALHLRHPGAHRRPEVGRARVLVPAGHALVGVVAAVVADHRADEGELVGHLRDAREMLADADAGDVGVDGLELAADVGRGVRFEVPHVDVGRPAGQVDVDDRLVRRADAGLGLGGEEVGQRQGAADERAADGEEIAAAEAVAEAALPVRPAEDRQHESPPSY